MKKNAVEIRPWEESDRPFLRTIYLHARREGWPWLDGSEWQLEDFDADTLGETILVAQADGHRLGFASIAENDNFLHHLFVAPDAQGRGVGAALLEAVQARFTGTGALKCLEKNERALRFYARHGWVREGHGDAPEGAYLLLHFRKS
ncbi:GNAT family N-acetyltransferase [Cronobacter malonaticus]|uniref:GNAT family N-acetyltransferase n=1 Tax=Cronobacter malonaticus TaxID=413503 RepID=UPI000CFB2918|nr:GNAT family N-acetyltransferase [Cronobacter malonaticus]ELY4128339.1 GNAT family N-acetyltransferase [Cronobacter malonaticus]MDT3535274.1 GNAT family N-acetyltransferase [Cronobacter malonaticus]NCH99991.1 GNAT family N-acetyltransferase [Cronobacter malonaticus]